jgi:hypothetical protein
MKYVVWAIATMRDVLNYNEHSLLTGDVLDRIEGELALLEDIEDTEYTAEQYDQFNKDLIDLNMSLLPNTNKIIKEIEQSESKQ